MRAFTIALLTVLFSSFVWASEFSEVSCETYSQDRTFSLALKTVAKHMDTTVADMCSWEHLFDVYVTTTTLTNNRTQKEEPHIWVTLHYSEHSCQYFVRNIDQAITKKGCYNTF